MKFSRALSFALCLMTPALAAAQGPGSPGAAAIAGPTLGVVGTIRFHGWFPSKNVAGRTVEVWLPPGYAQHSRQRYPVVYMHDGQNLFDPATSLFGVDWGVDETMTRLITTHRVRPAIVVAIWNTPARVQEYMPRKPLGGDTIFESRIPGVPTVKGPVLSDAYLRFIVGELKPFIDSTYRTLPGRANTFVMGSSMGGLISAYAVAEYPQVFGGAACLSTHWSAADGAVVRWLATSLPDPQTHRFYFDHGSATLDTAYAPWQQRVDSAMRARGYREGRNWVSRVFPGAEHSERAWRVRLDEPLVFLLGR